MQIFLTNSKKCSDKTLVTKQFSSPKQRERASKSSAPLHFIRKDRNHITKERERVNFPMRGANFSQVSSHKRESYDENKIENDLYLYKSYKT
jgi:hypothetical protein